MAGILIALEKFPPAYTGAGVRALKQSRRLKAKFGHDIRIVCLSQGKIDISDEQGLKITRLKCPSSENALVFPIHILSVLSKTSKYLNQNKKEIDLIHFFSFTWIHRAIMLWNILKHKKKTILDVTLQGQDDPQTLLNVGIKNRLASPITKFLLMRIDKFIVGSEEAKESCIKTGISPEKVIIKAHPCEEKEFETIPLSKQKVLRKKLSLPSGKFIVMTVGRIQERKNQLLMAQAITSLKNKNISLLLIGPYQYDIPYTNQIKSLFKENHMEENLILTGEKKNVNEYMIASDAYAITSSSEGFPTSVSEALVSGLPVISTYTGPTDEFIRSKNRNNGILINTSQITDSTQKATVLAKAIETARKTKYNRQKIRNFGIKTLSSSKIDQELNSLYHHLLTEPNQK